MFCCIANGVSCIPMLNRCEGICISTCADSLLNGVNEVEVVLDFFYLGAPVPPGCAGDVFCIKACLLTFFMNGFTLWARFLWMFLMLLSSLCR